MAGFRNLRTGFSFFRYVTLVRETHTLHPVHRLPEIGLQDRDHRNIQ